MSGLDLNTYYGTVSKLGRVFNKLDLNQTAEAIEIAQINVNNNAQGISKGTKQNERLDLSRINFKREPIEYVVEASIEDKMKL